MQIDGCSIFRRDGLRSRLSAVQKRVIVLRGTGLIRNNRKMMLKWSCSTVIAVVVLAAAIRATAQQSPAVPVNVGNADLGGVVTGPGGPEAGVWVIAETSDLRTPYTKIVVTDDLGRYLIPDLPQANYRVWVRGSGLVDSAKVPATPGKTLNLTAVSASDQAAAAQYYPPIYWFSLLHVPAKSEFPLERIKSQGEWLNIIKSGACQSCHALGTPGTRIVSKRFGIFADSAAAWAHRLQAGSAAMGVERTDCLSP